MPLRFSSVGHYCAVFRGLLLEELRAGLAAAHEEHMSGSTSGGGGGRGGGGFKCLPITIESVQRQSKVFVVTAQVDTSQLSGWDRDNPRAEDFIVVTRVELAGPDLGEDRLPRSHLSGLVVEASNLQLGVRQVVLHVVPASAGSEVMATFMRDQLVPQAQLFVSVITSLKPNFREFQVGEDAREMFQVQTAEFVCCKLMQTKGCGRRQSGVSVGCAGHDTASWQQLLAGLEHKGIN